MIDPEIRVRFTVLFWAVGTVAALQAAMLGMMFTMWQTIVTLSYQVGQIGGQLGVLINYVALK